MVIRQLRGITPAQAGFVARAVAALPAGWWVEHHDEYDGHLTLVVSRDGTEAATFTISGEANRIELCEVRGDTLHTLGCFGTMDETAAVLVALLRDLAP